MEPTVTVFTTTYNRAYVIGNLYQSLLNQTCKDFEWIVVNDGSTDETDELISAWIKEGKLQIHYINLHKNGGIANAMNFGIQEANGTLFFKIDSDDIIVENAIEKIIFYESTIIEKNKYAGVSGYKFFSNELSIGNEWSRKEEYIDATNFERKKYHLDGDKAEAYYTEVLRKFAPFPIFEGENYAFEGILWNRIANAGLKIRWFKDKLCQCEYLPDGMTAHFFEDCKKNYNAYTLYINEYKNFESVNFYEKYMALVKYFAVSFAKGVTKKTLPAHFEWNYVWLIFAYAQGWMIYYLRLLLKPQKYR